MSKSQVIQIRVSEEEKREWQQLAKDAGMSVAQWIRHACEIVGRPIKPAYLRIGASDPEKLRDVSKPLDFTAEIRTPLIYPKVADVRVDPTAPVVKRPGIYPKHPASRIKRGRPKTSERLRSMREGK